jgi:hypothetical protein
VNKQEVGKLLTVVALVDNREINLAVVDVWHDLLSDLAVDEANEALRKFRRENPGVYLEPGHIYQIAQKARAAAASSDGGILRPPAPFGKRYAVDAIEQMAVTS